jgi:DNA-binding NarL/FixJ family response regulator
MSKRRGSMKRHVILVVEDHEFMRDCTRRVLEQAFPGALIVTADDGGHGVTVAERTHPDVVVMDLHMPGIGGIEATRRIRAGMSNARVVVLTLSDNQEDRLAAHAAGASAYVQKDEGPAALTCAVRRQLRAGRGMRPHRSGP